MDTNTLIVILLVVLAKRRTPRIRASESRSFGRFNDAPQGFLLRADGASGSSRRRVQCHGGANERL